ncbi:STAS domain-containing protein [Streptomyces cavernae]|uniref:STAS domain-containing protein n=1 Tax=Streptomyces cavernae TaxID=2259034 RepID=UPI000FEBAFE6|nr:STAS domain-containing protein [Streptomyces cavernae]
MPPEPQGRAVGTSDTTAEHAEYPLANPYARTYTSHGFTVVEVHGEIDMSTAGELAAHLDAATAVPEPCVLVDLRQITFFDCSGLRVLCRAESRAKEQGGSLRLVSDRPAMRRLLRAAGLLTRFPPLPELPLPGRPESGSAPPAP